MYDQDIPGRFDYENIYQFAVKWACSDAHFVEVGATSKKSASFLEEAIRASGKTIQLDVFTHSLPNNVLTDWKCDAAPYPLNNVEDGLEIYPPRSLDFVFIDIDGLNRGVAEEIDRWLSLLKPGGILAGHDYCMTRPDVCDAVRARFGFGCAVPQRSWAIRQGNPVAGEGHKSSSPLGMFLPCAMVAPGLEEFDIWRRSAIEEARFADSSLAAAGIHFGEPAVETLVFLIHAGCPEVQWLAVEALAALLTHSVALNAPAEAVILSTLGALRDGSECPAREVAVAALEGVATQESSSALELLKAIQQGSNQERGYAWKKVQLLPRNVLQETYDRISFPRLTDCLCRVEMPEAIPHRRTRACLATVALPDSDAVFKRLMTRITEEEGCSSVRVALFQLSDDVAAHQVAQEHGAISLRCCPLGSQAFSLLGALCSIARVVDADRYLCVMPGAVMPDSIRPILDALDALHEMTLLYGPPDRAFSWESGTALNDVMVAYCGGTAEDAAFVVGEKFQKVRPVSASPRVFAGHRQALLALDRSLRSLQPFASAWLDAAPEILRREELLFSIALDLLETGVELRTLPTEAVP